MKHLGGGSLTALLWAGVVVAASLVGVRWVDSTAGPVAVLQSVVPLAGVLLVVVVVTAAVTRRWRVTVASGALLAVCATIAVPSSLFGHSVARGPEDLVVMSANLQYGAADAQSLVTAARQRKVDLLVLIEVTPASIERLRAAGLDTLLPDSVGQSSTGAGGTIIRSRIPMTQVQASPDQVSNSAFDEPVVLIHRPTGDVVLRAVHSVPPGVSGAADWRSGLAELQRWRERQSQDRPFVMAGDFNSSWGHPGYRGVAETMTDANRAAGQVWVPTWPQGRRLIRPFIQLDHVLSHGLGVVDAGVVSLPETDHAAVWARLSAHSS